MFVASRRRRIRASRRPRRVPRGGCLRETVHCLEEAASLRLGSGSHWYEPRGDCAMPRGGCLAEVVCCLEEAEVGSGSH